jgi:hypothetical protein
VTDIIEADYDERLEQSTALARRHFESLRAEEGGVAVLPAGPAPNSLAADPYIGVAAVPFTERAQTALAKYQTVPDGWIDIKPNGQIYLAHMKLRAIYNEAFGFGGWGLVPAGPLHVERVAHQSKYPNKPDYEHVTVYREYRLYVDGRFVRQMMGAGDYYTNNPETNYADAVEASESYALNRSGKPFGIASQCWDKQYGEEWKRRYACQRDGKWVKKQDTGAGAQPPATTQREPPRTQTDSSSASDPEPPAPVSSDGWKRVRLHSLYRQGEKKGKKWAMYTDVNGDTYGFGESTLVAAQQSIATNSMLDVRVEMNGKWRNVVEAKPGGASA